MWEWGGKKDFSTGKTNIVGQGHAHMCTCARLYHETYNIYNMGLII